MSDDIQKINTISGGQNAQNVYGNQVKTNIYIENQNNQISQNLKIELQYKEGMLNNEKEVLTKLFSLSNYNFDFIITGLNHIFENKMIIDISLELKMKYIEKSKLTKDWNIKNIREFIQSIFEIKNFFYIYENYYINTNFINLLTNFILKEKIAINGMPNLDDFQLTSKFYKENNDFDFIEIFGYEFSKSHNLSKLIEIFKIKFDDLSLEHYIEEIRNHNNILLDIFLSNFENSKECTFKNLFIWLHESNIKSNLTQAQAKTIDDLLNLGLKGYFKDEDVKLWQILEKRYKSPNAMILKSFFNNHKCSDWTIYELDCWLEKNKPDSDLRQIYANSIDEIFDLVFGDGYFMNEDATLWNDLQNLYR